MAKLSRTAKVNRSAFQELNAVRAERERLALAVDRGEVIRIDEIEPVLERYFADIRACIDGLPDKYTALLDTVSTHDARREILGDLMTELLETIGNFNFPTQPKGRPNE